MIKFPLQKMHDTIFVIAFSALYNVSVCIISDIYDESQVYYLRFTAPTDAITLCFLSSAHHYNASGEIAPMANEEHEITSTSAHQQGSATAAGQLFTF